MTDDVAMEEFGISGDMADRVAEATNLLRALANETRLMILCMLADGEKSVSELEQLLDMRQPTVSQQLARLRGEDLVGTRRDGKVIYYSLESSQAKDVIVLLYNMFCAPGKTGGT